MNRVLIAADKLRETIQKQPPDVQGKLSSGLEMSSEEFFVYQNVKSEAHAAGRINLEEANTLYEWLNNYDKQPLWNKIALTKVMAELLAATRRV